MFKQSKGITLIALVVTVVILLILAGISISEFSGNGIIDKTKQAQLENKRSQIREYLILKLTEEKTDNPFGSAEEIVTATRDNVLANIDNLKKYGKDIIVEDVKSEEDYEIVDSYFYVTVDDDVYKIELTGVTFMGPKGQLSPVIRIINIETTTNSILVDVEILRNEGGKVEYYIKSEEDDDYKLIDTLKENSYTYKNLTQGKKYSIKVIAVTKNKMTAEVIAERILGTVEDLTTENTTFTYSPSEWTNGSVTATASTTVSGYTIQTSKDGTTFTSTASQTFTANGTMYVRLTDGTNVGGTATGSVTNIDKTKPVVTGATATTNSIVITATDEASGIIGYAVTTTSEEPTSFKSVTNTDTLNVTETELNQETTYYVWVKDEAGNISSEVVQTKSSVGYVWNSITITGNHILSWTNNTGRDITFNYILYNSVYDENSSLSTGCWIAVNNPSDRYDETRRAYYNNGTWDGAEYTGTILCEAGLRIELQSQNNAYNKITLWEE